MMIGSDLFQSFIMGGFECSTHRDKRGRRLDLIASTQHDRFAKADYQRLIDQGILTARDGVRWHLIETEPYRYDFSSLDSQIAAVRDTGIQIIWDLFHYGYPDDIDIFSTQFAERLGAFTAAVCKYLAESLPGRLLVCPINEISFFSWAAGERGVFYPCKWKRGDELKQCLVEAGVVASREIRSAVPDALIMFTDPAIHVVPKDKTVRSRRGAESYRLAQFQAYDAIEEKDPKAMDFLGLNYYFHNQWRYPSRRKIPRGHKLYRPLNEILAEFYARYQKPLLLAETGIEDDERPEWFRYVCDQIAIAQDKGVPLTGVCLYPIVNHPGWADDRHCHNGLWDYADDQGNREIYQPLSDEIFRQVPRFGKASKIAA